MAIEVKSQRQVNLKTRRAPPSEPAASGGFRCRGRLMDGSQCTSTTPRSLGNGKVGGAKCNTCHTRDKRARAKVAKVATPSAQPIEGQLWEAKIRAQRAAARGSLRRCTHWEAEHIKKMVAEGETDEDIAADLSSEVQQFAVEKVAAIREHGADVHEWTVPGYVWPQADRASRPPRPADVFDEMSTEAADELAGLLGVPDGADLTERLRGRLAVALPVLAPGQTVRWVVERIEREDGDDSWVEIVGGEWVPTEPRAKVVPRPPAKRNREASTVCLAFELEERVLLDHIAPGLFSEMDADRVEVELQLGHADRDEHHAEFTYSELVELVERVQRTVDEWAGAGALHANAKAILKSACEFAEGPANITLVLQFLRAALATFDSLTGYPPHDARLQAQHASDALVGWRENDKCQHIRRLAGLKLVAGLKAGNHWWAVYGRNGHKAKSGSARNVYEAQLRAHRAAHALVKRVAALCGRPWDGDDEDEVQWQASAHSDPRPRHRTAQPTRSVDGDLPDDDRETY